MSNLVKFLSLFAMLALCPSFSQAQAPADTVDGPAIFQRIYQLRLKLQPDNSDENGFLYMLNTPTNLHLHLQFFQQMPNDGLRTTLSIWAHPEDVSAHPEMLGKPSPFPQMWIRYQAGEFVEAGASHVDYPPSFQLDPVAHPNLIYDFADKTVSLP